MMRLRSRFVGCLCAGLLLCAGSAAAQTRLRDPFERPPAAPVPVAPEVPLAAPEAAPKLELRAVVFDGQKSLINVGGRILGMGETIAGYTVVKVEERGAVLAKDGARLKLMLDKENAK